MENGYPIRTISRSANILLTSVAAASYRARMELQNLKMTTAPDEMSDTCATQHITLLLVAIPRGNEILEVLEVGTKLGKELEHSIREVMLIGIDAVVADAQIEELHSHRLGRVCNAITRDMPHVCANGREVDEGLGRFNESAVRPPPGALRVSHIPHLEARTSIRDCFHATHPQLDPERQPQELELGELRSSPKRQEVRHVHLPTLVRQAIGVIEPLPERWCAAD